MKDRVSTTSKIIIILAALLVILLSFQAGVAVGFRRGMFATGSDSGLVRAFMSPRSVFSEFFHDGDEMNPHGAVGQIISVSLPSFMLKGPTSEQIINLSPTTTIRYMRDLASSTAIVVGAEAVVIGNPGANGQINAAFVRIMPPFPFPAGSVMPSVLSRPSQSPIVSP